MPYCPKCGSEVSEDAVFCPKCGAPIKESRTTDWREQRREHRRQRRESRRYEKEEHSVMGPLIGGLVLIIFGILFYFVVSASFNWQFAEAVFFVAVGLIILIGGLFMYRMRKREAQKPAETG